MVKHETLPHKPITGLYYQLHSGTEYTLNDFKDDTILRECSTWQRAGRTAIQRDLNRLERWADWTHLKSSKC